MKNPRISITPEAYKAIRIQAAIEGKLETDLLSEMVLSHISEETRAAMGAAANSQSDQRWPEYRNERPEEQKVKKSESGTPNVAVPGPKKVRLADDQAAIAKITELWASGERNPTKIAREIDYPKPMVNDNIRRMIKAGILQADESKGSEEPSQGDQTEEHDIYGDQHGDVPGENRQPEND